MVMSTDFATHYTHYYLPIKTGLTFLSPKPFYFHIILLISEGIFSCRTMGMNVKKRLYEGVALPTAIYGSKT